MTTTYIQSDSLNVRALRAADKTAADKTVTDKTAADKINFLLKKASTLPSDVVVKILGAKEDALASGLNQVRTTYGNYILMRTVDSLNSKLDTDPRSPCAAINHLKQIVASRTYESSVAFDELAQLHSKKPDLLSFDELLEIAKTDPCPARYKKVIELAKNPEEILRVSKAYSNNSVNCAAHTKLVRLGHNRLAEKFKTATDLVYVEKDIREDDSIKYDRFDPTELRKSLVSGDHIAAIKLLLTIEDPAIQEKHAQEIAVVANPGGGNEFHEWGIIKEATGNDFSATLKVSLLLANASLDLGLRSPIDAVALIDFQKMSPEKKAALHLPRETTDLYDKVVAKAAISADRKGTSSIFERTQTFKLTPKQELLKSIYILAKIPD